MDKASHNAEKPLVTVLLPCYNGMPFLPEALQSIRQQTYTNLEILCIDDGSTDETYAYLQEQLSLDPRIVVVKNEQNIKLIATLNKGVQLAKGEFIARMDADDVALPNRIEVCVNYLLENTDVDLVCPQSIIINEEGKIIGRSILRNHSPMGNYFASFLYTPVGHPEIVCKASLLRDNPYSTEEKALHTEDYELWSRLIKKGYRFVNIPDYLQKFRVNRKSVSNTYTELQDINFIKCASDHYFSFTGKHLASESGQFFRNRVPKDFTLSDILIALNDLKLFFAYFVRELSVTDKKTLAELKAIYRTHRMDILIQCYKRGSFFTKVKLFFPTSAVIVSSLFNSISRRYFFSKF